MKRAIRAGLSGLCLLWALPALAQDLVVYPAKGQSAEQLVIDQQSGVMSGSVVDGQGAFAVFGACTIQ